MEYKKKIMLVVVLVIVMKLSSVVEGGGLSYDFYEQSCPQVEDIVRANIQTVSLFDPTSPAALLRLMFHDCQVQGCDASILLDSNNGSEMGSGRNLGIRKRETISMIKSRLEEVCPQQVSCADIIILAAREAVAISAGPLIRVPLGRRDSTVALSSSAADASLPPATTGVDGMLDLFTNKGMTIEEAVASMGSHSLGVTHCSNILPRLYKPQGEQSYNMDQGFELTLKLICQAESSFTSKTKVVPNDPTAIIFDNTYYVNAMQGRGVLAVDAEMPTDPRTAGFVDQFAANPDEFFRAFSSAFVKLSSSGVLTGGQGVIRTRCNMMD